jgi:hypothetical protein
MAKLAPLPQVIGARKLQIRIRAWVAAGPFTFHFCAPSFDVLLFRVDQDNPASREISIFTLALTLVELQRTVRSAGEPHPPPLGTVTIGRKWGEILQSHSVVTQVETPTS